MKNVLWWADCVLALIAAFLFFIGLGQFEAVVFACSVLCGMAQRLIEP